MKGAVLLLLIAGAAYSLVVGYHVEPVKAQWSGWTHLHGPGDTVSQVLTINFDELDSTAGAYVELFAGSEGNGGQYNLSVLTYPGGSPIAPDAHADGDVDHEWVRFKLGVSYPESIIKGKKLEFRFTRSGSDSINYYYDSACGYGPYGQMIAPYPPIITPSYGLAMRAYGRMKPVDSTYFGADEVGWRWFPDTFSFGTFKSRIEESKVRAVRFDLDWEIIQPVRRDSWDWILTDSTLTGIRADGMVRPLALITLTPPWASSRWDSMDFFGAKCTVGAWTPHCAPRGLDSAITCDSNFLARFIDSVVHHYDARGDTIHDWEVCNESNDTTTVPDYPSSSSHYAGWWRRPNSHYPADSGLWSLCALYMRMARVVNSVVKDPSHTNHQSDKVAIGSMHNVFWKMDSLDKGVVPGRTWLDTCYAVARDSGWGVFWDAVSVHDYQEGYIFAPETLRVHAETLRAVMRKWEHPDAELWNTEYGWDTTYSRERDADNLCQAFVSHKASEANPGGGYDRLYWWYFHRPGHWGS